MHKESNTSQLVRQHFSLRTISFSPTKKRTIVELIALLFVILFLYTGISKMMDFVLFEEQLAESPILEPVTTLVAWGLPISEFIVSILLFFPRYRLMGLNASFVLMVVFTGYVIALVSFSTELPCSCGGILEALSWQGHLILNVTLVGLAILGIRLSHQVKNNGQTL